MTNSFVLRIVRRSARSLWRAGTMGGAAGRRGSRSWRQGPVGELLGVRSRVVGEVARREIRVLIRTRTWRVATVLLVGLTAVGTGLLALLGGEEGRREVRIGHVQPVAVLQELLADPERSRLEVTWVSLTDEEMRDALERGTVAVVVDPPRTLIWLERADDETGAALRGAMTDVARGNRADRLGLSRAEWGELMAPVEINEWFAAEGPPDDDDGDGTSLNARGVGLILTILTFVGLQVYGTIVVAGVVKEKADRVVEVLLAHIRARELLAGKVAGVTAVAALQVVAVLLTAAAVLTITDGLDLPVSIWAIVPLALVIFVLGFGFYATLLAVAGSLVSRMEEGQFISLPVTLPLIGIYVTGLAIVLPNPDLVASRVLSFLPVSSPLIMPIRVAAAGARAWEVALSVVLLLAAAWWAVVLAGRVYESTLLRMGTRTTWREALRLARRDAPS